MLILFVIAISLSMDSFSLALAYGTNQFTKYEVIKISLIVGLFHFIMPLLGNTIGSIINFKSNLVVSIIFGYLGIEMMVESFKNEEREKITSLIKIVLFAFAVSIDSFSIGIGISIITNNIIAAYIVFSITAFAFTFLGLYIGNKISHKIGTFSKILGSLLLLILSIIYLFK